MKRWSLLFICFLIFSEYEAGSQRIVLNDKPIYKGNEDSFLDHPTKNLIDGKVETFSGTSSPLYFVVDLQGWFNVEKVQITTRKNCCGDEIRNLTVGIHMTFEPNNFTPNELCGQYKGSTEKNKKYSLNCNGGIGKFVSFYQKEDLGKLSLAELEIFGDFLDLKREYNYVGCFGHNGMATSNQETVTKCINNCIKTKNSFFAGMRGKECLCVDEVRDLRPTSFCNINCTYGGDFCGGTTAFSFYRTSICLDKSNKFQVPCDHLRDCSENNGACGIHSCVSSKIGPQIFLNECVCEDGFKKVNLSSQCRDLNECEIGHTCMNMTTCENTEGSYTCVCIENKIRLQPNETNSTLCSLPYSSATDPKTGQIVWGVLGTLLFIILIIIIILICYFLLYKKKYFQARKNNIKNDNNHLKNNVDSWKGEEEERDGDTSVRIIDLNANFLEKLPKFALYHQSLENYIPHKATEGKLEKNKKKNKFQEIIPYDHNRVKLKNKENDYINASWISSHVTLPFKFISTQGIQEPEEIEDFWQMVLENDVHVIVFLAKLEEKNKKKCLQYWPDENRKKFGEIEVERKWMRRWPHYEKRIFTLTSNSTSQEIEFLWFLDWDEEKELENIGSLVNFYDLFNQSVTGKNTKFNVLVQGRCGVSRTGAFIAVAILVQQANKTKKVDFHKCLKNLREEREKIIRKKNDYLAVIKALVFYQMVGKSTIFSMTTQNLLNSIKENSFFFRIENEFKLITKINPPSLRNNNIAPCFLKKEAFDLYEFTKNKISAEEFFEGIVGNSPVVLVTSTLIWNKIYPLIPKNSPLKLKNSEIKFIGSDGPSNLFGHYNKIIDPENNSDPLIKVVKETFGQREKGKDYQNSPQTQQITFVLATEQNITKCFNSIQFFLFSENKPPCLVLYNETNYISILSQITLFIMEEEKKEVDVYQTVYKLYKKQSETNFKIEDYRKLYDFAINLQSLSKEFKSKSDKVTSINPYDELQPIKNKNYDNHKINERKIKKKNTDASGYSISEDVV